MRSEFESREAFECIYGDEDGIDLSKDETGEYSFQPSRFAYSFFLVAWQYRQTEVDELQKRVDELEIQLAGWKRKSMPAMLNGMCGRCGKEPLQGIVSDKEDYALLHCFSCGANKYEWIGEQAIKGESNETKQAITSNVNCTATTTN